MCPPAPATPDLPPDLGVRLTAGGAQFCVYAGHARAVEVCLFDVAADGSETERRVPLRHRAHGTWFDRSAPPAVPLGAELIAMPEGPPLAVLKNQEEHWPEDDADNLTYQFKGYRLDPEGVPAFLYHFDQFAITDRICPDTNQGLKRRLHIKKRK